MRELSDNEQSKIKLLTKYQVNFTLIEPTRTGLKKSIMDATASVRSFLKENNIHDFSIQEQGQNFKVQIKAFIYKEFDVTNSVASLYRPITKKGDPRIWFSGLSQIANPNDIVAIIYFSDELYVFDLTLLDIDYLLNSHLSNPIKELLNAISVNANSIANELLLKLRNIASKGPIKSLITADTSVGRTLETALGIAMNSSKEPDYKGIEIKAFRANSVNRKNLFAQVPDWDLSAFKSSAEILDTFGYSRDNVYKLYCTVSSKKKNSQGLSIRLDSDIKQIIESSDKQEIGDFVVWSLDTLHNRLQEKHKETFWVEAESVNYDAQEYFKYKFVEHTKKPIVSQFDLLIDQGIITIDHLIKRNDKGRVVEKGPLFKINSKGLDLLFPPSETFNLLPPY